MTLTDDRLLRTHAFINGQWRRGGMLDTDFPVKNPYDGRQITRVTDCGVDGARAAIDAAAAALHDWRSRTAAERADYLLRWHDLILEHLDDLALLLTTEQGKPLREARGEIRYGASFLKWFAAEGQRVYGEVTPQHRSDTRIVVLRQPVGVVAAITPWNFPSAMITRKVAPALAVGCPVIVKPAEDTPLSALALAELADRAGFPAGVFNMLPTDSPRRIGEVLLADERVRKLSFTGSTAVGKELMRQCADTVKRVSLELGGNAPFIVFDDADVEGAVAGAMASKFRNAGQTCVCANRIFVQSGVYATFVSALRDRMEALRVGDGRRKGTDIGPLINAEGMAKVTQLVDAARARGAEVVTGGERVGEHPNCFAPTLLTEVTGDMEISREEIFGPVAALYRFETEEEVIRMANDTRAGLAAYFYGQNHALIWRVAEALEYGMVGINTGMISTEVAPFGGVKESGFGREGSKYGVEDYLVTKYLCWAI